MSSLRSALTSRFADTFASLGLDRSLGTVEVSQRPELGQFQCNGALQGAKALGRNPRAIAQEVVDRLTNDPLIRELSIAGPGFININVTDEALASWTNGVAGDERLGVDATADPRRVVMDYGGQNVAKSMHVGHLRSTIIGDSLQRIFRFKGETVFTDVHLGDWGLQMGQLITELRRRQPDLPYFDPDQTGPYPSESPVTIEDLEEIYPIASARTKAPADADEETKREAELAREEARQATAELQSGRPGYRALWQHFRDVSIVALKRDFERLGITFDLWLGESDADRWIPQMRERLDAGGFVEPSEGAQVIFLPPTKEGEKEVPPLILVNRDGGVGYGTTDLATIVQRMVELHPDLIIYIVDQRQALHFEQVFRAARRTGIAGEAELEHLGFGTMNGPDGRPFKTRAGGVLKLGDLMDMATEQALVRMREEGVGQEYSEEEQHDIAAKVGIATIKFADLMNHRTSNYIFDLEKFTRFEGKTGAYVLYNTVRCKSILRKAAERGFEPGEIIEPGDGDRDLMLLLAALPDAVDMAWEKRAPNYLCDFIFSLAQTFSSFYNRCHILSEEHAQRRSSWLALVQLVLRQMESALALLGIDVPERM